MKTKKAGSRILQGAKEALTLARGEANSKNYRIHTLPIHCPTGGEPNVGAKAHSVVPKRRRRNAR
jgi:hypothetical protein